MSGKATVLLLHGSKDASWLEPFIELRDMVAAKATGARIAIACLQFGSPTLKETIASLASEGIRKVVVVPVFISTRGHVAKDVPVLIEEARKSFPAIEISESPAIGEFPAVRQAMIDGITEIASR